MVSQDLTINKMRLFSQYDDHERNYKQVKMTCVFTHFELGYLTSYNILIECIRMFGNSLYAMTIGNKFLLNFVHVLTIL